MWCIKGIFRVLRRPFFSCIGIFSTVAFSLYRVSNSYTNSHNDSFFWKIKYYCRASPFSVNGIAMRYMRGGNKAARKWRGDCDCSCPFRLPYGIPRDHFCILRVNRCIYIYIYGLNIIFKLRKKYDYIPVVLFLWY